MVEVAFQEFENEDIEEDKRMEVEESDSSDADTGPATLAFGHPRHHRKSPRRKQNFSLENFENALVYRSRRAQECSFQTSRTLDRRSHRTTFETLALNTLADSMNSGTVKCMNLRQAWQNHRRESPSERKGRARHSYRRYGCYELNRHCAV